MKSKEQIESEIIRLENAINSLRKAEANEELIIEYGNDVKRLRWVLED